jgi:cell division protein FtsN
MSMFSPRIQKSCAPALMGGTLVGVLIGLAVGVVIAAVIAIWFGKTQGPVVNKTQANTGLSAAEEADRNKTWDPNGGLFGKASPPSLQTIAANAAAKAASEAAAAEALVAAASAPAPAAVVPKAQVAPVTPVAPASAALAKPKPQGQDRVGSTDPIGDLARAKALAVATGAQNVKPVLQTSQSVVNKGADTGVYFVQAGAFKDLGEASAQRARLAMLGIETKVSERDQAGVTIYRVRAGVFKRVEEAQLVKSKLDSAGFETVLVKLPQ